MNALLTLGLKHRLWGKFPVSLQGFRDFQLSTLCRSTFLLRELPTGHSVVRLLWDALKLLKKTIIITIRDLYSKGIFSWNWFSTEIIQLCKKKKKKGINLWNLIKLLSRYLWICFYFCKNEKVAKRCLIPVRRPSLWGFGDKALSSGTESRRCIS